MVTLYTEKEVPFVFTADTGEATVDLDKVMTLDGVQSVSPLYTFTGNLHYGEYTLQTEIYGLYSGFSSLDFISGNMYGDNTNMPYLILNEAAAKSFSRQQQKKQISVGSTISIQYQEETVTGVICGIFQDNVKNPVALMSYDTASACFGTVNQLTLAFKLRNRSAIDQVNPFLIKSGISPNITADAGAYWEGLTMRLWQTWMISICFLSSGMLVLYEKQKIEIVWGQGERAALLVSGLTRKCLQSIYFCRIAWTVGFCALAAVAASVFLQQFSLFAIGILLLCCGIILLIYVVFSHKFLSNI